MKHTGSDIGHKDMHMPMYVELSITNRHYFCIYHLCAFNDTQTNSKSQSIKKARPKEKEKENKRERERKRWRIITCFCSSLIQPNLFAR